MRQILQNEYRLLFARDGHKALELARSEPSPSDPDGRDDAGHDGPRNLPPAWARPSTVHSADFRDRPSDPEDETVALSWARWTTLLLVSPPIVMASGTHHLSLVRLDDLIESRRQIIERLGRAAEFKDNETGLHRDPHEPLCALALASGWSEEAAEELMAAAPCTIYRQDRHSRCHSAQPGAFDARRVGCDENPPANRGLTSLGRTISIHFAHGLRNRPVSLRKVGWFLATPPASKATPFPCRPAS